MKAITLWQPWASLIAAGIKTSETRSWAPPADMAGEIIGIHAAQRPVRTSEWAWIQEMVDAVSVIRAEADDGADFDLPLGAMVATARLVDFGQVITPPDHDHDHGGAYICRTPYGAMFDGRDDGLGYYGEGRWVWLLDTIRPLDEPVAVRGRQKIWNWNPKEGT